MRARTKAIPGALLLCLLLLSLSEPGCRCGSVEESEAQRANAQALPDIFPTNTGETAQVLAARIPGDVDAALFVSSVAALVQMMDRVKRWRLMDPEQLEGIFKDLEAHHGINPGNAQSYRSNGFSLVDGLAFGKLGGGWFAIVKVEDQSRFESFLDKFINEEYGRPRVHEEVHEGVTFSTIYVLRKDLVTVAYVDGFAYLVAGDRLIKGSPPSPQTLERLLALEPSNALSNRASFKAVFEHMGSAGPILFYGPGEALQGLLEGMLASDESAEKEGDKKKEKPKADDHDTLKQLTGLLTELQGVGVAVQASEEELSLRTFVVVSEESLATLRLATTPGVDDPKALLELVPADISGLGRLTFAPEVLEQQVISLLYGENGAKKWEDIKGKLSVRFLMNFEDDVLYNLSGQALIGLFSVEESALKGAAENVDVIQGLRGAVFLPFKDATKADSYFSKVNAVSSLLPKGQVEIEDREGVMVVTIKNQRKAVLRLAYAHGVLGACVGKDTVAAVIERLRKGPQQPTPPYVSKELLGSGPVWGVSLDMSEVVAVLSARLEVVKLQINRFLAPLRSTSLVLLLSPSGLDVNLSIHMTPVQEEE